MSDDIEHYPSSGNIFADLGLDEPEMRRNRALLAMFISDVIEERKLTQSAAAQIMGIDQPKVSAILRGRLSDFSLERMMRYVTRLGYDIRIVVEPKPAGQETGQVMVEILAPAQVEEQYEKVAVLAS